MTIKHLVISGGGPILIQILAAIQELEHAKYININDISTIYGTSAGALLATIIALKFDWETINDYIIKRPWQDVFEIKPQNIFDAYTKRGIFDITTIEKCFKPLFDAKDIPLNINLNDFFELTKVELHIFSFEINKYQIEDISYKTYPTLPLLQAMQMTCSIPVLLSPVFIDDKCFMDGGVACNYPLKFCIDSGKKTSEILGFKNKYSNNIIVKEDSTLLDYLLNFLFKSIFNININNNYTQPTITNEVIFDSIFLSIDVLKQTINESSVRRSLFEKGKQSALNFLGSVSL